MAAHGNEYVGAIVCKLDMHRNVRRGYIAMLAVRREYRKLKIGTTLVQKAIEVNFEIREKKWEERSTQIQAWRNLQEKNI